MSVTVTMPEVAETIVEGTIARWLKHPGDPVERYESIAEIVTDKVTLELPSPAAGFMGELLVAEGETVTVGTPIAILQAESDVDSTSRPSLPDTQASAENDAAPAANSRQGRHSPLVRTMMEVDSPRNTASTFPRCKARVPVDGSPRPTTVTGGEETRGREWSRCCGHGWGSRRRRPREISVSPSITSSSTAEAIALRMEDSERSGDSPRMDDPDDKGSGCLGAGGAGEGTEGGVS